MRLSHLQVRNLGVLKHCEIEPSDGFTVITGETGAGKTLLLGGIRLLLGLRPSIAPGPVGEEAVVEGLFSDEDDELAVSRVLKREGRSRAYLDGILTSAGLLQEHLGGRVEVIGQHDQTSLQSQQALLRMVDQRIKERDSEVLEHYEQAWTSMRSLQVEAEEMGGDVSSLLRDLDLNRFQADEIEAANLSVGLDADLQAEFDRLNAWARIKELVGELDGALRDADRAAGISLARYRDLAVLDPTIGPVLEALEGVGATTQELLMDLARYTDSLVYDEGRADEVGGQLTRIGDLKRKYGGSVEAVLAFGKAARSRADEIESAIVRAGQVEKALKGAQVRVDDAAIQLSQSRKHHGAELTEEALLHLRDLAMPEARLEFSFRTTEPRAGGADSCDLLFSASGASQLTSVRNGASGGELSRLVLALRLAARQDDTATLVFDEIDTGIGGRTASAMGDKLGELAQNTQLLCVTHLPQVASRADTHYVIDREGDVALVRQVDGDARTAELSRMIGALPDSEAGRLAAEEMLELGQKR